MDRQRTHKANRCLSRGQRDRKRKIFEACYSKYSRRDGLFRRLVDSRIFFGRWDLSMSYVTRPGDPASATGWCVAVGETKRFFYRWMFRAVDRSYRYSQRAQ